jgi:hypothetical protein
MLSQPPGSGGNEMNQWEELLVDKIAYINRQFGREAICNEKKLRGLLRDLAPELINRREYKMLEILLKCDGANILCDALNGSEYDRKTVLSRLTGRMVNEYVMDSTAAERICALFMTGVSGDSGYISKLDSQSAASSQPKAAPKPQSNAKSEAAPAPGRQQPKPLVNTQSKPTAAPQPKPTAAPQPKPQQSAPNSNTSTQNAEKEAKAKEKAKKRRKNLIWTIGLLVICAAFLLYAYFYGALDDRMVKSWLAVNNKVIDSMLDCEFDYLNSNGVESLKSFTDSKGGFHFQDANGDVVDNFTISSDKSYYSPYIGDYQDQFIYFTDNGDNVGWPFYVVFKSYSDTEYDISRVIEVHVNELNNDYDEYLYPFLPKYISALSGLSKDNAFDSLGITNAMRDWLSSDYSNDAFTEVVPDNYSAFAYPRANNNSDIYFSGNATNDNGETVSISIEISFDEENNCSLYIKYAFNRYPQPDTKNREIASLEKLSENKVYCTYTDEDLRMARAWIAAEDNIFASFSPDGLDTSCCTTLEDAAAYYDSIDGIYFSDGNGGYTDSFTNAAIEHNFYDSEIRAYALVNDKTEFIGEICCDEVTSGEKIDYVKGKLDFWYYYNPSSKSDVPNQMYKTLPVFMQSSFGKDSNTLLKNLGITNDMVNWLNNKQSDYTLMRVLFGRSDPSIYGNMLRLYRYIQGTDGSTVYVDIKIDIPEDGEVFDSAWVRYKYY